MNDGNQTRGPVTCSNQYAGNGSNCIGSIGSWTSRQRNHHVEFQSTWPSLKVFWKLNKARPAIVLEWTVQDLSRGGRGGQLYEIFHKHPRPWRPLALSFHMFWWQYRIWSSQFDFISKTPSFATLWKCFRTIVMLTITRSSYGNSYSKSSLVNITTVILLKNYVVLLLWFLLVSIVKAIHSTFLC